MKKLIVVLSVFLFLSFNLNIIAAPTVQSKTFSQGFYNMKDLNLSENISYSIQNLDPHNSGLLIILDGNQVTQQFIRLMPQSPQYSLIPLRNDFKYIIYGNIQLVFS
jgi:hypothetical protein